MQAVYMRSRSFGFVFPRTSLASPRILSSRTNAAVKLYTNPGSRGKMPEWYLAELGNVDFEAINVDMRKGEHKTAEYRAVHPFGQVPAMTDGDLKLFESGAILLHLAQKYGGVSGDALSQACVWVLFANASMGDAFFGSRKDTATPPMLATLDELLGKSAFIAGSEFTVSDVAVGSYLLYLPLFFPNMVEGLKQYKNLYAYLDRLTARPKCPQAYKDGFKGKK